MMVDKLNYILQDIFGYKWYTYVCMYVSVLVYILPIFYFIYLSINK